MTRIKLKYSLTSIIWRSETILSIGTGDRNGFRNLERKNLKRKHSFEEIHFKILSNYRSSSSATYSQYWPYDVIFFRIFILLKLISQLMVARYRSWLTTGSLFLRFSPTLFIFSFDLVFRHSLMHDHRSCPPMQFFLIFLHIFWCA